jgi:hypothetical protein
VTVVGACPGSRSPDEGEGSGGGVGARVPLSTSLPLVVGTGVDDVLLSVDPSVESSVVVVDVGTFEGVGGRVVDSGVLDDEGGEGALGTLDVIIY